MNDIYFNEEDDDGYDWKLSAKQKFDDIIKSNNKINVQEFMLRLESVANFLAGKAYAFESTGNSELCRKFLKQAETIEIARLTLQNEFNELSIQRFKDAEISSWNVLKGVLVGSTINSSKGEKETVRQLLKSEFEKSSE